MVPELNLSLTSPDIHPRLTGSLALLSCEQSFPPEVREWETAPREGARPLPAETQLRLLWATSAQLSSTSRTRRSGPHRGCSQRSHQLLVSAPLEPPPMPHDCPSSPNADVHGHPGTGLPQPGAPVACSGVYKYQKEDRKRSDGSSQRRAERVSVTWTSSQPFQSFEGLRCQKGHGEGHRDLPEPPGKAGSQEKAGQWGMGEDQG